MKNYEDKLLSDWEDVYRQGLLTFWLFIALQDEELDVQALKRCIEQLTDNSYVTVEQTLYRVLRKHYDLELVDYREVPGESGSKKKLYSLSSLGEKLLKEFTIRNISFFSKQEVQQLIIGEKK